MDELKIIIPSTLVILGWFASNWLAVWRDERAKRVELRFKYLVDAHRAISSAACRKGASLSKEQKLALESAIEDIQLLGNDAQLKALHQMICSEDSNFNDILSAIRQELRLKMKLTENKEMKFYRL